jgi:hypothetical protein
MTGCTERHPAAQDNGLVGEGQEGMAKPARSCDKRKCVAAMPLDRKHALSVLSFDVLADTHVTGVCDAAVFGRMGGKAGPGREDLLAG